VPAFATAEDLATHIGKDLSAKETATASQALDHASEVIRGYTQQTLDLVTNDPLTLYSLGEPKLFIPQLPIVSVASVVENGTTLPTADYYVEKENGLLYKKYGFWYPFTWGDPGTVVITYTHGFATIPQDIKNVCEVLAGGMMTNPVGVSQESLGTYSATYKPDPLDRLNRYRRLVTA